MYLKLPVIKVLGAQVAGLMEVQNPVGRLLSKPSVNTHRTVNEKSIRLELGY